MEVDKDRVEDIEGAVVVAFDAEMIEHSCVLRTLSQTEPPLLLLLLIFWPLGCEFVLKSTAADE